MTQADYRTGRDFAEAADRADPLRHFRDEFNFPVDRNGLSCVYLCGNSLGLQPKRAVRYVEEELTDWANLGVEGHLVARRPWLPYHRLATGGLARLTGSEPREVVAMNTLTVNLHVLMTSFYRPAGRRRKIVIESTAFPSDRFAAMSQLGLHGHDPQAYLLEWTPRVADGPLVLADLEAILADNDGEVALLLLPGVQYYSGEVLPMKELCRLARGAGAAIGLDLAHAIGNVPLSLHDWGPDFAAWCSYKYLNAGPGAIGGAFVHARHLDNDPTGKLLGWWGHDEATRFRMAKSFTPADGAELWQLSNPPILSLAPVVASLELFAEAGMDRLRAKSERLTGYLDFLLRTHFAGRIGTITPADARGCQLSLVVLDGSLDAREVFDTLVAQNVVGDWREPNVIRVAPVPLYNSYGDVYEFARRLSRALGDDPVGGVL
ncbi:MAG: kynureninase [Gammaproteobacteria bacterium]|nr:kynureninase [Gammaproteobacteria bacterium]